MEWLEESRSVNEGRFVVVAVAGEGMSCEEGIVASIDTVNVLQTKSCVRIRMRWRNGLAGTFEACSNQGGRRIGCAVTAGPGRCDAWLAESQ